jgi:hypothetical protein
VLGCRSLTVAQHPRPLPTHDREGAGVVDEALTSLPSQHRTVRRVCT